MKKTLVDKILSVLFARIGYFVGEHPQHCIAVTLLMTFILGSGFINFSMTTNIEYLFSPVDGRAKSERESVRSLFAGHKMFENDILRITTHKNIALVIATTKNNVSMMDDASIEDLDEMDAIIRNVSIFWKNKFLRYRDICLKNERNQCPENFVSFLKSKLQISGKPSIRYPVERNNFELVVYPTNLGGVSTNKSGYLVDFKALRLYYFVDYGTAEKIRIGLQWEKAILDTLSRAEFRHINVLKCVYHGMDVESSRNTELAIPLVLITAPIMILFSMISCMTLDVVGSKPWVGVAGLCSPILATIAAFGLLLHCKMDYVDSNMAVALLMIGVGMDDSFVLLASWRRTNSKDSVKKRMSDTFSEAGVAVAITSLTNFSCFCVGLASPYRMIRIFCAYSALSVIFDLVYQIVFFGSLMALDGYREEHRLHSFLFYPVKRKSLEKRISETRSDVMECKKSDKVMKFVSEKLGTLLGKKVVKITVITVFFCTIAGSIYGMKDLKQGMEYTNVFPFNSYLRKFSKAYYKYFTDYPHVIQIVFNQTLDYSDSRVQHGVEDILQTFSNNSFLDGSELSECWLREYLSFIRNNEINYLMEDFNTSDPRGFVEGLKRVFLRLKPASHFRKDIAWNNDKTQIVASRCLIASVGIRSGSEEKMLLENLRAIADRSKYRVFVYNPWFIFFDQYLNIPIICLQNVGMAVSVVTLIFLIVIQNIPFAFCIALNVVCILVETVGYMSFWKVNLDLVSIIILVMSSGFCVDSSAHVAYAYCCSQKKSPEEKIKDSLFAAGYPVIQGCLSTMLGVVVLAFGPSYIFVLFFKLIFLVMIFALFHALFLLPVMLSITDSFLVPWKKKIVVDSANL